MQIHQRFFKIYFSNNSRIFNFNEIRYLMKYYVILSCLFICLFGCKKETKDTINQASTVDSTTVSKSEQNKIDKIKIHPIQHATMVLEYKNTIVYVDPVGGKKAFENMPKPNIILVTDIHGDHFDVPTLETLYSKNVKIIVPNEVAAKLPETLKPNTSIMSNGQNISMNSKTMAVTIEAIPMYNLREEALKFQEKGRGNGYVVTLGENRIYISGDTEDIPEMRNLKNIDIAFVCMNLPYTMPVERAASAVLDFKPQKVYPYHYRGTEGLSDVKHFKNLVNKGDNTIEVVQLNWYPE